jgi:hypothetical protein
MNEKTNTGTSRQVTKRMTAGRIDRHDRARQAQRESGLLGLLPACPSFDRNAAITAMNFTV